ncbi:MAG: Lrp/AsnC family transcriptional regulator [Firmicutes bacterium]|nr:Lrp/AsnC family transcriptional regulator [Bacillota bacterium]
MDSVDLEIIKMLQENGRMSHEEMGRRLNLSRPSIHQRVKKLEADGVIRGYRALIDWSKLGSGIAALISVRLTKKKDREVTDLLLSLDLPYTHVEECHRVAGEWCMMIKLRSDTPQTISKVLDAIYTVEGVTGTSTTFILNTTYE